MLKDALLATSGPDGGVSLIDVAARTLRDFIPLPNATFIIEGDRAGIYYVLHGDAQAGYVTRIALDGGVLRQYETVSTGGAEPCHAAWVRSCALVIACYTDSRLTIVDIASDGVLRVEPKIVELHGRSRDPDRQERAHPHFVAAGVGGHDALVVDLGSDIIWALDIAHEEPSITRFASVPPGTGPRHAIVAGDTMLLSGELSAEIATVSLTDGTAGEVVAATHLAGDAPAYPGDICLTAGRAALAVRGRSSVSLFDIASPTRPELVHETVIDGSWVQQLLPVGNRILAVDRDGGRLVDLDPETGVWNAVFEGLSKPMWLVPLATTETTAS